MAFQASKDVRPSGARHGLAESERRDPLGLAVAALNRWASSDLADRLGIRKASERGVYRATSVGFRAIGAASRTFARRGEPERAAACLRPHRRVAST